MTVVVDASLVVAALVDGGATGAWAEAVVGSGPLAAPHLMPAEVANVLRRLVASRAISADTAAMAHDDLAALRIDLFPYDAVSARAWQLRDNLTIYDAWYVALAETLGAKLATLDVRLSRAVGPRCVFSLPPPR